MLFFVSFVCFCKGFAYIFEGVFFFGHNVTFLAILNPTIHSDLLVLIFVLFVLLFFVFFVWVLLIFLKALSFWNNQNS